MAVQPLDMPAHIPGLRSLPVAPPILEVRGLTVGYNHQPALEDISFEIRAGERVAIIGPNGAGKSTLIKTVMGLLQPQRGTITTADGDNLLGYVPQHEGVDWDFPATVRDVVMMGCVRQIGWLRWPRAQHWQQVHSALERVGMTDLAGRQIGELSGGQRRRVFIARALAQQARVLMLDEPFSGVDASAQGELMDVLDGLHQEGLTILLCTHDLALAFSRFDRVMALRRRMIAFGPPEVVYQPNILSQLYGGQLATWQDGKRVMVFVDDHHCEDCP
jgi:ABC-type Mn2+/Zn2+ transport system ATPase subunit